MDSGWDLWELLECIGVVSECCYKEVYTVHVYIHFLTIYLSLLHLY